MHAVALAVLALAAGTVAQPSLSGTYSTSSASVLQYHNLPSHNGTFYDSLFTTAAVQSLNYTGLNVTLPGSVWAQPLYLTLSPSGRDAVIVATNENIVAAIDAATGSTVWQFSAGTPITASALQQYITPGFGKSCDNINPQGITGTPVINSTSRTIFFNALTALNSSANAQQYGVNGPAPATHVAWALNVDTGRPVPGWPVNVTSAVDAQGEPFATVVQQQRGALTLVDDVVYIPYGGFSGDCDTTATDVTYRGFVVGITGNGSAVTTWATNGLRGGAWSPVGVSTNGQYLYIGTGNTLNATAWSGGEAALRLNLGPSFTNTTANYMVPADWQNLDKQDEDIGSSGASLIHVPGAVPSDLVVTMGKNGVAYIEDANNLGGFGGSLYNATVAEDEIINAPAAYTTANGSYVAFHVNNNKNASNCPPGQSGDLAALKISATSPPTFTTAWCATANSQTGSPMAVQTAVTNNTQAIVFILGSGTSARLQAYNGDTGALLYTSQPAGSPEHFITPIVAKGHVWAALNTSLVCFALPGAPALGGSPAPASAVSTASLP